MTEVVDERFRDAVERFLRGDLNVFDFNRSFMSVVNEVADARPLQGAEVDLFHELEVWETAGWDERVHVVDRLREMAKTALADGGQGTGVAVLLHADLAAQGRLEPR